VLNRCRKFPIRRMAMFIDVHRLWWRVEASHLHLRNSNQINHVSAIAPTMAVVSHTIPQSVITESAYLFIVMIPSEAKKVFM
jgi:hypothetical protein